MLFYVVECSQECGSSVRGHMGQCREEGVAKQGVCPSYPMENPLAPAQWSVRLADVASLPRLNGEGLPLEDYAQYRHGNGGDDCGGWERNNPRQGDRLHQVPICCLVDNAHAQHGADEDVGGRYRKAQDR